MVLGSGEAGESVTFVDCLVGGLRGGMRIGLVMRIGFPSFFFLANLLARYSSFCLFLLVGGAGSALGPVELAF